MLGQFISDTPAQLTMRGILTPHVQTIKGTGCERPHLDTELLEQLGLGGHGAAVGRRGLVVYPANFT